MNVQISFLLAGKTGFRQILGSRAGTDCDVGICAEFVAEVQVSFRNGALQMRGERCFKDQCPGLFSPVLEFVQFLHIEAFEQRPQPRFKIGPADEFAVSLRRGGKAVRNANTLPGEMPYHFAQRGVLTAYQGDVLDPSILNQRMSSPALLVLSFISNAPALIRSPYLPAQPVNQMRPLDFGP